MKITLLPLLGIVTLACALNLSAELESLLTADPGNRGIATMEWTVHADGTDSSVTGGNSVPTTGSLINASGDFLFTWSSEENFDETTLVGTQSVISGNKWNYNGGNDTFGPRTDSNTSIQIATGEAIVMTFDLTNLNLDPGYVLQLDSIIMQNSSGGSDAGARFSFFDQNRNTITQLTGSEEGQISPATGDNAEQSLNQIVSDGDEIAFWRADFSGQVRMKGFQFSVVEEPPLPVANNDSIDMHLGHKATITVLDNDLNLDELDVIEIVSQPSFGTVTDFADSVRYEHTTGTPTSDSFTYRLADLDSRTSAAATVTINFSSSLRVANTNMNVPSTGPVDSFSVENAFGDMTFFAPLSITSPPNDTDRVFISEKFGSVQVVTDITGTPTKQVFIDFDTLLDGRANEELNTGGECGLLSIAFHPDYDNNGYFFAFYSVLIDSVLHQRVSRFTVSNDPNVADTTSEVVLIEQFDEAQNHNGGDLQFGPDGYLYISVGDEGGQNDANDNSQTITKDYFSGILRIDVDKLPANLEPNAHASVVTDGSGNAYYSVPADNPWVGATSFNGDPVLSTDVITEFYAVGMRNPWRTHFDPLTGDYYVADVGQNAREEVNLVTLGGNYGWAFYEASLDGPKAPAPAGFVHAEPLWEYERGTGEFEGRSVSGGVVYRGDTYPELYGKYIVGDYVSGNIWSLDQTGGGVSVERLTGTSGPVGFGYDPSNGDVLIADINLGIIQRLVAGAPTNDFPATLSETRIFADLTDLSPNPGVLFYDPNLPFWSDHAVKYRWFVIPDSQDSMTYAENGPWTYPSGMVWIKHFEMELERGNPSTAKRIETRLLVKNDEGAYGVSYRWNEDETEAYLVPAAGETFTLDITDNGSPYIQTWQIPSRSACFSCHLPSAGYSLSFNTRQLNKDFNLGNLSGLTDLSDNQIQSLRDSGYLNSTPSDVSRLPRYYAATETDVSLEARVRSYISVNCAYCHNDDATNPGVWDGSPQLLLDQTNMLFGLLNNDGGDSDNRVVIPGDLTHSALLSRIEASNGFSRMPPLATFELDDDAIALVRDWIQNELPQTYMTYNQWRIANFGNDTDPIGLATADADGDGNDNELEWSTFTNPNDASDFWRSTISKDAQGDLQIDYNKVLNRSVILQESDNLIDWNTVDDPENLGVPSSGNAADSFTLPLTDDSKFYRFDIEQQ